MNTVQYSLPGALQPPLLSTGARSAALVSVSPKRRRMVRGRAFRLVFRLSGWYKPTVGECTEPFTRVKLTEWRI